MTGNQRSVQDRTPPHACKDSPMFHYLDLLGVIVFAVSGALEARKRGMDVFGACAIGFVTALGGGTLQDMVLQHGPVFWVRDSTYIVLVTLASVATFLTAQRHAVPRRILLIADAGGLAVAGAIPLALPSFVVAPTTNSLPPSRTIP
ncbi:MAG: TRIC cation channel family protein [Capsulimonadaceae bacterium]|nr:TRIC cation channel family protein [Capsulimonadaceae bacterium]